jgi:hypothetical protein
MDRWRTSTEQWLSSEQQGLDDAADAAFAQVFAALPPVDPSADFIQRACEAAWVARRRERRITGFAALAACVAMVVTGAAVYWTFGLPGGWVAASIATLVTNSAVSFIVAINTAVQWWFATVRAGNLVAGIMATPQSAVVLLGIELIGVGALYMLQRLLRAEPQMRGPGALCF